MLDIGNYFYLKRFNLNVGDAFGKQMYEICVFIGY